MNRVCFLMHSFGGGAEPNTLAVAAGLDPARFQVSVRSLRHVPALARAAAALGLDFSMPEPGRRAALGHALRTMRELRACNVVVGSLELQSIFWAALAAPGRAVAWLHKDVAGYLAGKSRAYGWLYRTLLDWALMRSRFTACVSQGLAASTQRLCPRAAPRVRVLWNPVNAGAIGRRAQASLPPTLEPCFAGPVILGVGRLEPQKRFDLLLEAHALLRGRGLNQRLCIAGEGSQRAFLERRARELGVEDSTWLPGFVDPFPLMARASALAVSSDFEGFCMVLAEALSLGLPVVSTRCPSGPAEILDNGRFGELVPMNDAPALAAALERLLRQPPDAERRAALRERAAVFSPQNSVRAWAALLDEAAGSQPERPGAAGQRQNGHTGTS